MDGPLSHSTEDREFALDNNVSNLLLTSVCLQITAWLMMETVAMVEMAYVIIRLLSEYDRIIDLGNDDVQLGITITLAPHPGVNIGFARNPEN